MDDVQDYQGNSQDHGDDPGFSGDLDQGYQYGGQDNEGDQRHNQDQGYEGDQGYYQDQGQGYQYGGQVYEGDVQDYEYYDQESWWEDTRIAGLLVWLTYAVGACGIALGIYGSASEGAYQGLHLAFLLMVGASGILSFIRYSIFHRSDAIRSDEDPDESLFQIEVGFVNLGIGIMALLVFFGTWGTGAEVALTLSYAGFLILSLFFSVFRHLSQEDVDRGIILHSLAWLIMIGFMFFFSFTAAAPAHLFPF